ncbi:DUF4166 domain-containing protein [Rhizobium sp. 16-449-1b]|uniref:DUF4166 domain-containing protein n=1 Tax=Rhizobium sp. 16-449-1b TaxID=2819989 RepID=UPI001ADB4568|nr:DUF4166 domain-containing protein [Rhizobium sp. 16-449-1b]MBO9193382.1 DUF4166 domain-containing protein [Rhizobium sp. 16-449-1b]
MTDQHGNVPPGPGARPPPLYRRLLGQDWDRLPPCVAALHDVSDELTARGRADIERGRGWLAQLAATLAGFPKTAAETDVEVHFLARDGIEVWTRRFGGKAFRSVQMAGGNAAAPLLAEDLGPFRILMALVVADGRLLLQVRGWRFLGLPMPMAVAPGGTVHEEEHDGRFRFHVEVRAPLVGLIVRYRGWLVPTAALTPETDQLPAMPSSSASSAFR